MKDPRKILLALQFWEGDKKQAMQVARLIADLEPRHCNQADFLFVSRFDCEQDMDTIKYVSQKFNVHHHINRSRRATGWPFGPNELWFGTMDYVFTYGVEAKRMSDYKAVLTFEADAFPLIPNWIQVLSSAWDEAQPACVVGALQTAPAPHINGNALFSCDHKFMNWIARAVGGCAPHGGWDFILAQRFKEWGWRNSGVFRSWWQMKTLSEETFEQLLREHVCFLHGIKDQSVIEHVRRKWKV